MINGMLISPIFLVVSCAGLLIIFLANLIVGLYHGFGGRHYWFFQLEHVLGGFFVIMFFQSLFNSHLISLIGLAIVTLVWECLEYGAAHISSWELFLPLDTNS
ncbi:MAG: hypothetical protein A3I39_03045 [Candidatus Yanofskybacteria bacterium RIFCSPLOWO2_02_FULL_47_9b]|uniref:Uncharacterized protein n=1 Tax=Candidatus Yanofskybacteria bacterium RIFCSPLOWO2_02_FULL_47_9b TaxID=1802708 RepID=A0A1F8H6C8_9BACT|nr:MAG: hypothetical protein A3I39_03045 [Candidatus Yanofskybacteria bacterium RIFCSPLOWO2_02_FULL_47_9b]